MAQSGVMRTPLTIVSLWTLALLATQVYAEAEIDDVNLFEHTYTSKTSLLGSRNGGTRIALLGSNLMNPDGSFDSSVRVTVGGYEATVLPFLSTPEKIVFDTPAVPENTVDCCHQFVVRHSRFVFTCQHFLLRFSTVLQCLCPQLLDSILV